MPLAATCPMPNAHHQILTSFCSVADPGQLTEPAALKRISWGVAPLTSESARRDRAHLPEPPSRRSLPPVGLSMVNILMRTGVPGEKPGKSE